MEVEIVLDGYWKERPGLEMKAAILADWMDELEDWTVDQIRHCLRQWRSKFPSKKPNPGHISQMLKEERGQAYVAQKEGKPPREIFKIEEQQEGEPHVEDSRSVPARIAKPHGRVA